MKDKNLQFFKDNKAELVNNFTNKFIVIANSEVIGSYDSEEEAYFQTIKTHDLGTFIIQLCSLDESAYIQTYHSRASF